MPRKYYRYAFIVASIVLLTGLLTYRITNDSSSKTSKTPLAEDSLLPKTPASSPLSLQETAQSIGDTNTFIEATIQTQTSHIFNGAEPVTIFIPSDQAFDNLSDSARKKLFSPDNITELSELILSHVSDGSVQTGEFSSRTIMTSLSGKSHSLTGDNNQYSIDNATIIQPNIAASNGTIHIIDTVLLSQ